MTTARENLGPAERIIQTLLTYQDHMYHGRTGAVVADPGKTPAVAWKPVTYKVEAEQKVVYELRKIGKKTVRTKLGTLRDDKKIVNGNTVIGEFRDAGLFPEIAAWFYKQIADVWALDNEFAAKWASYAFTQEHRDLKMVLCAFMLVQSRKGEPVLDGGKIIFHDDDYRNVGEAMILTMSKGNGQSAAKTSKKKTSKKPAPPAVTATAAPDYDLNAKQLLRVYDLLTLPAVAQINRELGFGSSTRKPFLGRWPDVVTKWLRFRERNPHLLTGLVKAGFRTTVMELARKVGYKPEGTKFFEVLRWKQIQTDNGHRTMAIGVDVTPADSWEGLDEEQICKRIVADKANWKTITSKIPVTVGVTRAIMAAAIETGALSNRDLMIATPTLEELGLLNVAGIKDRWLAATKTAADTRAANIARNVRSKEVQEQLTQAADAAVQKVVEEVTKDLVIGFIIDISGSMQRSIEAAKTYVTKLLGGFPLEKTFVVVFNSVGRALTIKHASSAGVENAFKGVTANGGTAHASGVRELGRVIKVGPDQDLLLVFIGDEGENGSFAAAVQAAGLKPTAFGFVKVPGDHGNAITTTAAELKIPLFPISTDTFADPYAITRTLRNLAMSTPVGISATSTTSKRKSIIDIVLETPLLSKPAWA